MAHPLDKTPEHAKITELLQSNDSNAHLRAALNGQAEPHHLEMALQSPISGVHRAVAKHPKATPEILSQVHKIHGANDPAITDALASHPKVPDHVLEDIAHSSNPNVPPSLILAYHKPLTQKTYDGIYNHIKTADISQTPQSQTEDLLSRFMTGGTKNLDHVYDLLDSPHYSRFEAAKRNDLEPRHMDKLVQEVLKDNRPSRDFNSSLQGHIQSGLFTKKHAQELLSSPNPHHARVAVNTGLLDDNDIDSAIDRFKDHTDNRNLFMQILENNPQPKHVEKIYDATKKDNRQLYFLLDNQEAFTPITDKLMQDFEKGDSNQKEVLLTPLAKISNLKPHQMDTLINNIYHKGSRINNDISKMAMRNIIKRSDIPEDKLVELMEHPSTKHFVGQSDILDSPSLKGKALDKIIAGYGESSHTATENLNYLASTSDNLTDTQIDTIAQKQAEKAKYRTQFDTNATTYILSNPNLKPEQIKRIYANHPNEASLHTILRNKQTPKDLFDHIVNTHGDDNEILAAAIENPHADRSVWIRGLKSDRSYVRSPAERRFALEEPDTINKIKGASYVNVNPDLDYIKRIKGIVQAQPGQKMAKKDLEKLGFNISKFSGLTDPKGNLTPEQIDFFTERMPSHQVPITTGSWMDSRQRHMQTGQSQKVMKMNLTNDMAKQLRDNGLSDIFKHVSQISQDSNHPVDPHTIGWARYDVSTKGGINFHVDEIQNDFHSFYQQVSKYLKKEGKLPDSMAKMFKYDYNPDKPEEFLGKLKKLVGIISLGHEDPNHTIQSAVMQQARKMGVNNVTFDTLEDQVKQAGLSTSRDIPAHFIHTYDKRPKKIGAVNQPKENFFEGQSGEVQMVPVIKNEREQLVRHYGKYYTTTQLVERVYATNAQTT
jgi:uncharacterized protein YcgL (UPF0745 family)